MRVIDQEELAILLYETNLSETEYTEFTGNVKPHYDMLPEHSRDDYRRQASRMLEVARVALK